MALPPSSPAFPLPAAGTPASSLLVPPPLQTNSRDLRDVIGKGQYPLVLHRLFAYQLSFLATGSRETHGRWGIEERTWKQMDKDVVFLFLVVNSDAHCIENPSCAAESYLILWPHWIRVVRSTSSLPVRMLTRSRHEVETGPVIPQPWPGPIPR